GAEEGYLGDALVEGGHLTESERQALEVIEAGRSARGVKEVALASASASDENATVEMRPPGPGGTLGAITPCETASERFTMLDELGRGGIGAVYNAFDHNLQRHVAIKVMLGGRKGLSRPERFIREAKLSGQLQHPNIVPVYDLGEFGDATPFFSMRLVRGRSLAEVLEAIRRGETGGFSPWRLLFIFQSICMGIAYAHDKGIVHRDLKPENVMIGDFGEVLVMDWGLAKFRDQDEIDDDVETTAMDPAITSEGTILGTPIYMSPEQAAGTVDRIDERSDIYSLGAILYEILTLFAPFQGGKVDELLDRIIAEEPVPPSTRAGKDRRVHPELDRICLKALMKDKADRYASARAMHDDVQRYVDGAKERIRRREEAREAIEEGKKLAERYFAMREVVDRYEKTREVITKKFKGWEPVLEKKELWAVEDQLERMFVMKGRRFADAVNKFVSALEFESDNKEARENLARLYWGRFLEAEERGDQAGENYFLATAKYFNDGILDSELSGDGSLSLETDTPGTRIVLSRYRERDRIHRPEFMAHLDPIPMHNRPLPMGSYLLECEAPGKAKTLVPVRVGRGEGVSIRVRLFAAEEMGDGFVHVPAGRFVYGGDPSALAPKPRTVLDLPDFFIARFPVTCAEYLEFLNDLPLEKAKPCVPVEPGTGLPLWELGEEGRYVLPGPAGKAPFEWHADLPVVCVSWNMAKVFCAWRSDRDGRTYTLPSEEQWEKAARGVDGRLYPWGDRFDPTYCKNSRSRPGVPGPEPVGVFPVDASPFGVRDMAGGVREWCSTAADTFMGVHTIRGGSWAHFSTASRCASRFGDLAFNSSYVYGFRLATTEPFGGGR
ncbi:MAG: protein kinase domain-containing protein, partial [Planctomycetota bacterium]